MPELPEVEVVKRGLAGVLPGQIIKTVKYDWPKSFPNAPSDISSFVHGARITAVKRRAKMIIIDLSTGYSLVVHLKMTGQLVFRGKSVTFGAGHPSDSLVGVLPDKSTRVIFEFTSQDRLFFNDVRKFGWVKLVPTQLVVDDQFFKNVGPEPLDKQLNPSIFVNRIKRRQGTSIKAALLDQSIIAGVGNIYADEALFTAKIHPSNKVSQLTDKNLIDIFTAVKGVLQKGIDKGGSTDRNYVDAMGNKGSYLVFAQVFRRDGQACYECGTIIDKIRVAGRGTHICTVCQVVME